MSLVHRFETRNPKPATRNPQPVTRNPKPEMEENQNQNQLNIELTEEIADGIYSNLAIITHSTSEFVVDFVKIMPGVPKAKVKARILLTPQHAKRLLAAMQDNIAKYEAVHGTIKMTEGMGLPMNFGGPAAQA